MIGVVAISSPTTRSPEPGVASYTATQAPNGLSATFSGVAR